jgi:hypothetical protein
VIKTSIAIIVAIVMIGITANSAGIPKTFAAGGLMSLVANGAQDVYLTQNDTTKLQTDENKLKSDMTQLQDEEKKNSESDGKTSQSDEEK